MLRLQLRKGHVAVETSLDNRHWLESQRKLRPDLFRYGRIREILQLGYMPERFIYEINGPVLDELIAG